MNKHKNIMNLFRQIATVYHCIKILIIMFVKPCDLNRIMWITFQEFCSPI
jgi:hypothetical protein